MLLSHDIDQIYDRELFKILGDVNHLRRMLLGREKGNATACVRRVVRALLRPKPTGRDVDRVLAIEKEHGWRSTFFFLEDPVRNRYGGRYRYADPACREIAQRVLDVGGELAVHGAYHALDSSAAYGEQRRSLARAFGHEPVGIRNHYLLHRGETTWDAQQRAGFAYDATFGFTDRVGLRDGKAHPFFPLRGPGQDDFVVLPLTLMDSALFRRLQLSFHDALRIARSSIAEIRQREGLLCLSWHNNYFDEPEYAQWERAYEVLLGELAAEEPWCATGQEIADWWVSRRAVVVDVSGGTRGQPTTLTLVAPRSIHGLTLSIDSEARQVEILDGRPGRVEPRKSTTQVVLGHLHAGAKVRIRVRAPR